MNKLLKFSGILAVLVGIIMVIGSIWGIAFTYRNVAQEKIVTAADSSIPNVPLRGPMTLKAQADIIREHTLKSTGGKTYAEMPREIQQLDSAGNAIFDKNGKPVMIPNTNRDLWITSMTLTTALNLPDDRLRKRYD